MSVTETGRHNEHLVISGGAPVPIRVYSDEPGTAPVLFHVPHASVSLPQALTSGCCFSDGFDLKAEAALMDDAGTDLLAGKLAGAVEGVFGKRPEVFSSLISRVLVDMERFDSDDEEMNAVGMGVVYEKAHDLSDIYACPPGFRAMSLRRECYNAYAAGMERAAKKLLSRFGRLLIVDIHSYAVEALPYELHKDLARPLLCVGANDDVVADWARAEAGELLGRDVSVNEPFIGSYCPLSLWDDERVTSIMFEFRKDAYDHGSGALLGEAGQFAEELLLDACREFAGLDRDGGHSSN